MDERVGIMAHCKYCGKGHVLVARAEKCQQSYRAKSQNANWNKIDKKPHHPNVAPPISDNGGGHVPPGGHYGYKTHTGGHSIGSLGGGGGHLAVARPSYGGHGGHR